MVLISVGTGAAGCATGAGATAPHGESDGARLRRLCVPDVARPERLDFSGADLSGADLSWLNLSGVIFGCAKLVGTKLYGSLLTGCDFRDADLTGADLRRSRGEWANFERAQFGGARLCRASLTNCCYAPVKHMKSHAYRYQQKIDRELAKIERIQTLQQRAVGLVGTLIISTSIGISNFVSRRVYTAVYGDGGA